jgi:hypothetical protein
MMEGLGYSETSVLRNKRRNIPENGIVHSHRSENYESYNTTLFSIHFILISSFSYSSTQKMEAIYFSETSVEFIELRGVICMKT